MASIKEQIAAVRTRFDVLEASLRELAKSKRGTAEQPGTAESEY